MRLRPKKKKFKVKIRNLSIQHGIYINEYMRQMENNGEIYNAIFQHDDIFYVEGIRGDWVFHRKHLEFVDDPLESPIPEPQLFDINQLDI